MKKTNLNLKKFVFEIEPPESLKRAVLSRIAKEKEKVRRRKEFLLQTGFVFSVGSLAWTGFFFGREIMASDFWAIASLALTDLHLIVGYWQEFGWSLLENFPATEIAGILLPVVLMMFLVKKYAQQEPVLRFNFR